MVKSSLTTVHQLTKEVEALHKSALLMADAQGLAELSGKIEIKLKAASINIESSRKNLKLLDAEMLEYPEKTSPEYRANQTKHRSMCNHFLKIVAAFERMQETYKNKYRTQLERQYLIMKPDATREELDQLAQSSQTSFMLTQQVFKSDILQAEKILSNMKERHEEIMMIEKSMSEIQAMFNDIAMLVNNQGDMINTVDEYIRETKANVQSATEALKKRAEIERKRQIKRITLYFIGAAILIILLAVIGYELSH